MGSDRIRDSLYRDVMDRVWGPRAPFETAHESVFGQSAITAWSPWSERMTQSILGPGMEDATFKELP